MEYLHLLVLLLSGLVAGFINVLAGGGSTLTLPVLLFLGLDAGEANGTNRVAILVQNVTALNRFHKKKMIDYKGSLLFALITLPGAISGAFFAVRISNELFRTILGLIIIGIVVSMFFKMNPAGETSRLRRIMAYPALFVIGFYGGFIQAGVGFLLMAAFFHLLNQPLAKTNVYKVFIICAFTVPALIVFAVSGNVNWFYGLVLAAGNATGGRVAAHFNAEGKEKIIKGTLIAALVIISLKLII